MPAGAIDGLRIRPFAAADFDALVAGWHATNQRAYAYNAEHARHTREDARSFFAAQVLPVCDVRVAEAGGVLCGLVAIQAPWVRQLAVFAPWQRRGVGSALLQAARALSPGELRLYTFQRNAPARAFYARHGFVEVAYGVSPAPESEPDVELRWRASG